MTSSVKSQTADYVTVSDRKSISRFKESASVSVIRLELIAGGVLDPDDIVDEVLNCDQDQVCRCPRYFLFSLIVRTIFLFKYSILDLGNLRRAGSFLIFSRFLLVEFSTFEFRAPLVDLKL